MKIITELILLSKHLVIFLTSLVVCLLLHNYPILSKYPGIYHAIFMISDNKRERNKKMFEVACVLRRWEGDERYSHMLFY